MLFVPASPLVGNIEQEFDAAKLANSGDSADSARAIKVFGEVNAPGSFTYKPNTTLVDVVMRAGGVTRYASVEQIRVITNNTPTMFNLKTYLDTGDQSLLPEILPGATIFVPKQEEEIKAGANVVISWVKLRTRELTKVNKARALWTFWQTRGAQLVTQNHAKYE